MKVLKWSHWVHLALILSIAALLVVGCGEDKETKKSHSPTIQPTQTIEPTESPTPTKSSTTSPATPAGPPEIPPLDTFVIDFDAFNDSDNSSFLLPAQETQFEFASFSDSRGAAIPATEAAFEKSNWGHAAFNVGFWNVIVFVGLAVPVAAFVASFQNIPLQQPDGSWVWSYSVRVGGKVYTAELHGIYIDQGVRWEMYITQEGGYSHFNWFYGESDRPATEGFWILKKSPDDPVDLLRIDWHRNIADGTGDIKYTNIEPGGKENGGYIYAETTHNSPYDAYWDIYNKGQDNHTYIEWNRSTEEGRVKDFKKFGDNEWHCWDSNHNNIDCP